MYSTYLYHNTCVGNSKETFEQCSYVHRVEPIYVDKDFYMNNEHRKENETLEANLKNEEHSK